MTRYDSHFPVPIAKKTRVLFFEPTPGHSYLFDLYGRLPEAQFVGKQGFFWTNPSDFLRSFLDYSEKHLRSHVRVIVFMTLDMFLHVDAFPMVNSWLQQKQQRIYGFLHEVPEEPAVWERLRILSQRIQIIVLSEEMKALLEKGGIASVLWLPHHAVHFQYERESAAVLRDLYGIPQDAFVATFLGELRKGKGIELILDCLKGLQNKNVILNFAGKATDYLPSDIRDRLQENGISARLNVSRNADPAEYRVMSDRQYVRELLISDALLLPYIGRQGRVMSGVLPDAVHFGVPVLCTRESIIGTIVEKYGLGRTFSERDSFGLAIELNRMMESRNRFVGSQKAYASLIDPQKVLKMLTSILNAA